MHSEVAPYIIARLLNQIYVVQPPMLPLRHDDAPPGEYEYSQPHTSTDGARPSAPQFPEHLHHYLPIHRYKVWLHDKNLLHRCFITILYKILILDDIL